MLGQRVGARKGAVAFFIELVSDLVACSGNSRKMVLTRKRAVEGLLARMTPHVSSQSISARVWDALSSAVDPFAAVFLLSGMDVLIVEMQHEQIHVALVAGIASVPFTHADLLFAAHARTIFVVCKAHAAQMR
jgi:hypothetical protein